MKKVLVAALFAVVIPGCAGWQKQVIPVLSDAAAFISDAQEVVNIVRAAANIFFMSHPDTKAQVRVEHILGDVSKGIDAAIRATKGAEALTAEQLDLAWMEFRRAYAELQAVLSDVGILGNDGRLGALRDHPQFPEPLALRGKH